MPRKAASNRRKHGVSFEEARTVLLDEGALQIPDPEHSDSEDRFVMLGLSGQLRILVVCHCFRENDEVIESSRRGRPIAVSELSTTTGGGDEKALRFLWRGP